jgi:rhodanese-related sulfurtransferase
MRYQIPRQIIVFCAAVVTVAAAFAAQAKPASSIPSAALIQPADLAAALKDAKAPRPLILQVGFKVLFAEAHIAGAEYVGAAGQDEGIQALRKRVAKLPKDVPIVLYCGCCPWTRCPNIAAAYDELHALGFTNVKVLYIADNFGTDWVERGYPTDPVR